MSISIVIPIFNERENIPRLYDALTDALGGLDRPWELVLVDDGSDDGSAEALAELAGRDRRVKVIQLRRNFGQSAALHAGIQAAVGDVIVLSDGDLQNDAGDIPMLLERIDEGYDLVHGWRRRRQDRWLDRRLPSIIANRLISWITRCPVRDLGCALKAIRREVAQEIELYGEMHRFITILAYWRGARCLEVETRHHARRFGQSKYGLGRIGRVLLDLVTVKFLVQYLASPMRLFGTAGAIGGAVSLVSASATIWMKLDGGVDMTGNPLLLLSAFAGMAALQFFMLGMLGELGARIYFELRNRRPYAIRRRINFDHDSHGQPAPPPVRKAA